MAADRIDFASIKATEGGDFVDDRFAANWAGAGSAGLRRGAYHFFTLCTPGAIQARHFLAVVPEDPDALPPAVDVELAENCAERPAGDDLRRELLAFLEIVESATGAQGVLYIGNDLEERYGIRDELDRPLWLPRPLLRPDGDWWIWQASAFAHVSGVSGGVDLDVMRSLEPHDVELVRVAYSLRRGTPTSRFTAPPIAAPRPMPPSTSSGAWAPRYSRAKATSPARAAGTTRQRPRR